ncbi:DUF3576 domain-containing protein [Gemmobacter fulvus]|uniref:DUF3576 domain-containing protein n=1 Tax=Gemmobacter fulvus TaxID=2840474 RepID=A0A975RZC9_9RHOB|nr:DUF3576 domain-containing protein [Gemmobacter fulvus]MBT9247172.1 DUF3576 domain-containing protein [Gemmobacter fulvus]MDQ1849914.1 DUF3576 domain-containing protein [Gemmobacter fulvus]QWK88954.1 DUF3576 domain-containing protein [Gemmobacter fulvus]
MFLPSLARITLTGSLCLALAACGGIGSGDSGLFGRGRAAAPAQPGYEVAEARTAAHSAATREQAERKSTIWDLFNNSSDPNTTVEVNKYLWQASLEVLNFLPIESVDPFTGVIVTGYGTPPGGGSSYRATIYVSDPALDARSLKVSLQGRGGGSVSAETQRAVEDAILTRARAIRVRDSRL